MFVTSLLNPCSSQKGTFFTSLPRLTCLGRAALGERKPSGMMLLLPAWCTSMSVSSITARLPCALVPGTCRDVTTLSRCADAASPAAARTKCLTRTYDSSRRCQMPRAITLVAPVDHGSSVRVVAARGHVAAGAHGRECTALLLKPALAATVSKRAATQWAPHGKG